MKNLIFFAGIIALVIIFLLGFASAGILPGKLCKSDRDCTKNSYCQFKIGKCNGYGYCMMKPQVCTLQYAPVCGCDNKLYSNECEASRKAISIKNFGVCKK